MTIDELVKSPLTNYQFTQPNGEVLAGYAVIDADLLDLQEEPSQFIAQERHALMECLLQEINRKGKQS